MSRGGPLPHRSCAVSVPAASLAREMGTTEGRRADAPIGIADTGVGGLTVVRAVIDPLRANPVGGA